MLLALAYYLAFTLRFDSGLRPAYALLRERTIAWVVLGGLLVLIASRAYQRSWSYSSQRDYWAIMRGVVAITLLAVVGIAVVRPGSASAAVTMAVLRIPKMLIAPPPFACPNPQRIGGVPG